MSDKREYIIGVDIAKIIAMVFVVGVHVAGDGFECVSGGGGGGTYLFERACDGVL